MEGKNLYRCSIKSFFGSLTYFNIEATDKADALVKAKEYARVNIEWGGNYDSRSVQVVKKLQMKT
jgi:hypothetical protein